MKIEIGTFALTFGRKAEPKPNTFGLEKARAVAALLTQAGVELTPKHLAGATALAQVDGAKVTVRQEGEQIVAAQETEAQELKDGASKVVAVAAEGAERLRKRADDMEAAAKTEADSLRAKAGHKTKKVRQVRELMDLFSPEVPVKEDSESTASLPAEDGDKPGLSLVDKTG